MSNSSLLEAEIETAGGKQGATLIPENLMAKTIRKFNESLSDKIDEAGMRVFAHKLAGHEISSTATTPRKVSELDWDDFTEILESKITQIVRRELATTQYSPSSPTPQLKAISGRLSRDNQIKLAYEQILEIRDRWCEAAGISVSATGDNAFVQAIQNGKVPEVEPLLKFVKWGTRSGISRGTLRRIRAKLKDGIAPRNLDRPKEKKIDKYEGIAEWVRVQRKQHPEEPISCLHRRMQLQHPDKPVSLSTLMRWLETA